MEQINWQTVVLYSVLIISVSVLLWHAISNISKRERKNNQISSDILKRAAQPMWKTDTKTTIKGRPRDVKKKASAQPEPDKRTLH